MKIKRPVLRWHGGKYKLADWIISNFPAHRIYTEAFGGAASVLMRKSRSYAEIYNDLDKEVVNLFRVLRDPGLAALLKNQVELTPFARDEFVLSYQKTDDPIECARRLVIRSFMGFGSNAHATVNRSGFRANSNRSGTTPAQDWISWPKMIEAFTNRLKGVVIENRDALQVLEHHDTDRTLHYVDPPYVHSSRSSSKSYMHELDDKQHAALADRLHTLKGMVILSGYESPLYSSLYADWKVITRPAFADGARPRVECLWLNRAAEIAVNDCKGLFA